MKGSSQANGGVECRRCGVSSKIIYEMNNLLLCSDCVEEVKNEEKREC